MYCTFCSREIPEQSTYCLHCGNPVKQSHTTMPSLDIKEKKPVALYVVAALAVIGLIVWGGLKNYSPLPATVPTPVATPSPTITLPVIRVGNGEVLMCPQYEQLCPFSVKVSSDYDCYIYLKYRGAPAFTTEQRAPKEYTGENAAYDELLDKAHAATGQSTSDMSFYVKAGCTAEVDVPIGKYELYYACGTTWHGKNYKFGDETQFYSSDELLYFYADDQYYQGCSLNLVPQQNGNFDTDIIDKDEFPA